MRSRLAMLRAAPTSGEPAQIIVLFSLFLIVLLVLAGSAYDYASIVVDDAKLQNAVDAALLAGSDSLSNNGSLPYGTPAAIAAQTATQYLLLNGVPSTPGTTINFTFPTSTPAAGVPTPATPVAENITLDVSRDHPTAFWPLVGISSVSLHDGGAAHAGHGLIDVMLVLDTTPSMVASGSIGEEQQAVSNFVNAMNPSIADPRSARIALARFQGLKNCTGNNWTPPCDDNYVLLSGLSGDKAGLVQLGAGTTKFGCLSLDAGACPINNVNPPGVPNGGGTRLPDAIAAVKNPSYVFTGPNSRNDASVTGHDNAKKIVILMTDGENWDPITAQPYPAWDTELLAAVPGLELGPDGIAGTRDDVEIYTINYQQCDAANQYDPVQAHNGNCESHLASFGLGNHECPNGAPFAQAFADMSPSDTLLYKVSSSTAGTCDHYFPLTKGESLPNLFTQLAGTISRGALTQ